ncbi:MAG TPA: hypothetical protein VFT43_07860 [Candidatus Polarisedimenticolia bacterium]|nr:hypothetical protein [Candidatus Polarisedimenticolia bacterium]
MDGILGYVLYIVVKYLAYALWCFVGLRMLAPDRPRRLQSAALLGLARLALGVAVGLFIFFAALTMNNATRNAPLTYLAIYVPVRIFEWVLLHLLVSRGFQGKRSIGWVLGGVVISCLADVPLGIMEGGVVPVGRPFC